MLPQRIKSNTILLKLILAVSAIGLLFSGYLSYIELSGQGLSCGIVREMLKFPTCIYGFIMYTIIFILVILVIINTKNKL